MYRKGIDLVAEILPRLCSKTFHGSITVDFVIGGDGPKRIDIEEMIEKHSLQSRVLMLGELVHSDVRDKLLIKGKGNLALAFKKGEARIKRNPRSVQESQIIPWISDQ